jgi:ERCC4-type nuclease
VIRLDDRRGSGELERHFLPYGIKVVKTRLDFGDFDFLGNGPRGVCAIVVERKTISDLLDSMKSRRLSGHQLPGIGEGYDYAYLIVEGVWRLGVDGSVEVPSGKSWRSEGVHYRAVDNYLDSLMLRAGVNVWRTYGELETVAAVVDRYRGWNDKKWHDHHAHDQVYAPATPTDGRRVLLRRREVSLCEMWAMQLPGVDRKARTAAECFRSAQVMANAEESAWLEIEGIGKKIAARSVWEIRKRL